MSGKCVIDTPKQSAEHVDKVVKGITSLYLPAEDVSIQPDDIEASPRIIDTLQIHLIKRFFDEQNVPITFGNFSKWLPTNSLSLHNFIGKEFTFRKW